MALDDAILRQMRESPMLVLSPRECATLADQLHTTEEIAHALWEYGFLCWHRGRRLERAQATQAAMRPWTGLKAAMMREPA